MKKKLSKRQYHAKEGDIIVDFTQHLDVVIPVINKYLSHHGKEIIEVDLEDFH